MGFGLDQLTFRNKGTNNHSIKEFYLFQRIQTHLWSFYKNTFEKDGRLLGAR